MLIALIKIFFIVNLEAALVSSMPSTFLETGIPNSHLVTKNVVRSMAPRNEVDIDQLLKIKIKEVLIFKNETNGEVTKEINWWEEKGLDKEHIHHIDFPWKDITDFKPICEMTIQALNLIYDADINHRKIFFHCTVGEDRTGYLAGLYKLLITNQNLEQIFQEEMCEKGYEAGNPKKGYNVVNEIRAGLTPSFIKMAELINIARLKQIPLSVKLCKEPNLDEKTYLIAKKYQCRKSKLIP